MSRTSRRATFLGALVLLAATVQASPAAAAATPVRCGDFIKADTTLTRNVGPCSNGGLIIKADNITLDLGGFAVQGRPLDPGDGIGIRLRGHTGVTVRNGRITDFVAGVEIGGGSGNTIENLLVKDNIGHFGNFGDGIVVSSSNGNTVRNNDVIHNGTYDGIGLLGASSGNLIEGNLVGENNVPFTGDDGIRIEGPGATNNTVRANTVSGSTLDGIAVFSDQVTGNLNTGNVIEDNTVVANGFGFLGARPGEGIRTFLRANSNIIRNNLVQDNAGSGILIANGSLANQILTNTATGNARRSPPGTRFDLHDLNVDCDANVWSGNVFGTASQPCTTAARQASPGGPSPDTIGRPRPTA